jgi:hypothetical protein
MLEFEASLQHWLEISYTLVPEFYKSWTEEQTPKQANKQASSCSNTLQICQFQTSQRTLGGSAELASNLQQYPWNQEIKN